MSSLLSRLKKVLAAWAHAVTDVNPGRKVADVERDWEAASARVKLHRGPGLDLAGRWSGEYAYLPENNRVRFTLEVTFADNGKVEGTVSPAGINGPSSIEGSYSTSELVFTKRYTGFFSKRFTVPVHYVGKLDPATGDITGEWFAHTVGIGTFAISRRSLR